MQYGKDYEFDAPVKLLDKHLHSMAQSEDEQLVVVSQVCDFMNILHMTDDIALFSGFSHTLYFILPSFCFLVYVF